VALLIDGVCPQLPKATGLTAAMGRAVRAILGVVLIAIVGVAHASVADAACEPQEGPRFTPEIARRFMAEPGKLLGRNTSSYGLTVFVMQFSAGRPRDLDVFKSILRTADKPQQAAIGLGFARAVTFCQLVDSATAEKIDKWVTTLPARDVVNAYRQAMVKNDQADTYQPVQLSSPEIENRYGGGLALMPPPNASGIGNLRIPDPTSLPGD
jgi:hypothetical protein